MRVKHLNNQWKSTKCATCGQSVAVGAPILWAYARPYAERVVHEKCGWLDTPEPEPELTTNQKPKAALTTKPLPDLRGCVLFLDPAGKTDVWVYPRQLVLAAYRYLYLPEMGQMWGCIGAEKQLLFDQVAKTLYVHGTPEFSFPLALATKHICKYVYGLSEIYKGPVGPMKIPADTMLVFDPVTPLLVRVFSREQVEAIYAKLGVVGMSVPPEHNWQHTQTVTQALLTCKPVSVVPFTSVPNRIVQLAPQ